jgi:energy-coupling factor transporter ATP-binding protein EcfA2
MDNEDVKNENTDCKIEFNEHFKLPIYYNEQKKLLKENIITDLELINSIDSSSNPIYSYLFDNLNTFSKKSIEQVTQYYTTDIDFLKDNQTLIKTYKKLPTIDDVDCKKYSNIIELWNEIKNDTSFKEKYYYLDWSMLEFLNKSENFLQWMSIYNIASPVISFFIPIIILIIPFFVIKLKGLSLTIPEYIEVLKTVISNHAIGKLFTEFNNVEFSQKIYLLVSAGFYVFSIYQNIILCSRFNSNMVKIHEYFIKIKKYLENTINSMENYLTYSSCLHTHYNFNDKLVEKMKILTEIKNKISNISEYKLSFKKIFEIGHILKYFYEIYENKEYNDAFIYSFGFNGYVDCIEGLVNNIREKKINFAEFTNKKKKNSFKNNYYAVLKNNNPVKNNIKLEKNMIITGPNASGKTTVLKSVLINVILTQQFGCGFYDSAKLKPYKYIHCYLNIPDTSGRDSLFQSEARRCKEIIDIINSNKKDSHLCVFDELYSGTNPEEAIVGSTAFMEYLVKNKYVSSMLTTHFISVCEKLDNNKNITNYHMDVTKQNNKITYNYLFKEGISKIKGGLNVLYDMNYPKEIIENTIEIQKFDSLKENSLVK